MTPGVDCAQAVSRVLTYVQWSVNGSTPTTPSRHWSWSIFEWSWDAKVRANFWMSIEELVLRKEWVEHNMSNAFLHQLSPHFAAPVVFPKRPDGGLWLWNNYPKINTKMIKNHNPLALIRDTLNLLRTAQIYTKLDAQRAYILLRSEEGDEHKLAYRTRYCIVEPTVMQIGMTNEPACFRGYISDMIEGSLERFCIRSFGFVLAMGPDLDRKTVWFGSTTIQKPDPLLLGGSNPVPYQSTGRFCQV